MTIEALSAITVATHDMQRSFDFYSGMGFEMIYGGPQSDFTSFRAGNGYLNVILESPARTWSWWGRAIFYVSDVDATYERALAKGLKPDTEPRDAEWGERYFHITDPDGHELSFARPLDSR